MGQFISVEAMANHPNRGWRKTWSVDLEKQMATHQAGFAVIFNRVGDKWVAGTLVNENLVNAVERERLLREAQQVIERAGERARDGHG